MPISFPTIKRLLCDGCGVSYDYEQDAVSWPGYQGTVLVGRLVQRRDWYACSTSCITDAIENVTNVDELERLLAEEEEIERRTRQSFTNPALKTENPNGHFNVYLTKVRDGHTIGVIKVLREIDQGLGLKDAKLLVDAARGGQQIKIATYVSHEQAKNIEARLLAQFATVSIEDTW